MAPAVMEEPPHSFEESPLPKLVAGTYSNVGRKTKPAAHMLRGAFPEYASPVKRQLSGSALSMSQTLPGGTSRPSSPAEGGLDVTRRLSDGAINAVQPMSQPSSPKHIARSGTSSFTSLGLDSERFCEQTGTQHRRFVSPARREQKPELGYYKASHAITLERSPSWEIGAKPRHASRKDSGEQPDIGGSISAMSGSCSPAKRGWDSLALKDGTRNRDQLKASLEPMALGSERPSLFKVCSDEGNDDIPVLPTEDLHRTYERTTCLQRQAVYDFSKWQKRQALPSKECQYFEAGKYRVKYSVVDAAVRGGRPFQHHVRSDAGSRNAPKAVMVPDDGKSGIWPDRSLYRSALLARPRATHISDFSKELERPSIIKTGGTFYDDDDPEACRATLERELNFDASSVDVAVTTRRDSAPDMQRSLRREAAGVGARVFQSDSAMRSSKGFGFSETATEAFSSVEACKESPSREKQDRLVAIDRMKGRDRLEELEILSPLRKKLTTGPFERKAMAGFKPRSSTSTPVKRAPRAHEALPDWSPAFLEED